MTGQSVIRRASTDLYDSSRKSRGVMLSRTTLVLMLLAAGHSPAAAETISGALASAYGYSPDLNQQRALTRSTDESVPAATAGWRPTVSATGSAGETIQRSERPASTTNTRTFPRTAALTVTQTLYNGNRTANTVRRSESNVLQSREQLRQNEQNILASGAAAYMNVLRDTALLNLQENNVSVLQQQLKQTQDRFQVGEVTRTDVAQSQAALALGQAQAFTARSNLQNSIAVYRQLIGSQPRNLQPARPVDSLLPRTLPEAVALSQSEHPAIQSALHAVDMAALAVKTAEGALYPTVAVQGSVSQQYDSNNVPNSKNFTVAALANLTVPIYDGGLSYAAIRQNKELLGQQRLLADQARESVRSAVVSAWGAYQNTKLVIQSFQAQVRANEIALNGVREEAKVGQRTTLDVLNAQQTLLSSRVNLITSQRDQVVNSYALLAAVGRLSAGTLGLSVVPYDPTIHYDQVRDKWFGVRTPDGR